MTEPPATPAELPDDLVSALDGCSPTELRELAGYATELAAHKERANEEDTDSDEDDENGTAEAPDPPSGVPAKATLTTKEINGNRYHYWQWRDGDKVRSKYKGPAGGDSA
jgi:hypothetical protein